MVSASGAVGATCVYQKLNCSIILPLLCVYIFAADPFGGSAAQDPFGGADPFGDAFGGSKKTSSDTDSRGFSKPTAAKVSRKRVTTTVDNSTFQTLIKP